MIWLLLGLLLFGGAANDLARPETRAHVFHAEIGGIVDDATRRAAATAITERMVAEGARVHEIATDFAARLHALDIAATCDETGYTAALDAALDALDASERQLADQRMALRSTMTADEWTELMALVATDD